MLHPVYVYPPKLLRSTYGWWYWHSLRSTLERLLEDFRPDLIMGYWAHPDGAAAVRAGQRCGVPVVLQVGGSDIRLLAHQRRRGEKIREVLSQVDRVVTCSAELAGQVAARGISRTHIDVVYRGVDRQVFHPGERGAAAEIELARPGALAAVGRSF